MTNLEEIFRENHRKYVDDMLYELSYATFGGGEFTYNNPVGSITIKIKDLDRDVFTCETSSC